ncbi:MAG: hypothetical protein IKL92_07180 [Oscillospiraceae bacterium]|nr:hypothetical protein [Oscillospiraceae bacterium]
MTKTEKSQDCSKNKKRRVEAARQVPLDGKLPMDEGETRGAASHPLPFEEIFFMWLCFAALWLKGEIIHEK